MDTRTAEQQHVEQQLALIRGEMPEVYKSIQAEAAKRGRVVFQWVRRALRGEPNRFYAFERGHVVGTPFTLPEVMPAIAQSMVQFGAVHVCLFGPDDTPADGGVDGAH